MKEVQADYLVIGSGAMGMAFVDTLLSESDASVIMVDRHHQPGGHWNDAYPYVRLHQPSAFYGVNSTPLGNNVIDSTGWNKGLYELATNSEVCAYFDQVMQRRFLDSGRVEYFPNCEYDGDGAFHSLLGDATYQARVRKTVDATYMNVTVPSIRPPAFDVDPAARCEPPNALPKVAGQYDKYVIIGAGKTGMDACLFLLKNDVDPERITWVMPRDSWILDRANIQPGELFADSIGRGFARQTEAFAEATDIDDLFNRVEASGQLIRLDPEVKPTMYRCATVTQLELSQLQRIKNIVRQGRVTAIEADRVVLDEGQLATDTSTLHVDCSADGLQRRPIAPVFASDHLTLQSVRTCQQVFSAAFIAHVEAAYSDEDEKNELATPVPHPDDHIDFLRTSLASNRNAARWATDPSLQDWLKQARLDGFTDSRSNAPQPDPEVMAQMVEASKLASENLQRLLADFD